MMIGHTPKAVEKCVYMGHSTMMHHQPMILKPLINLLLRIVFINFTDCDVGGWIVCSQRRDKTIGDHLKVISEYDTRVFGVRRSKQGRMDEG